MDTQEMEVEQTDEPVIAAPTCNQFICFFDTGATGDEERDRYPVGFGKTREEALEMAFSHVLPDIANLGVYGMAQSSFATVSQPQLTSDEFASLGKIVTDFFAERSKLQRTEPA